MNSDNLIESKTYNYTKESETEYFRFSQLNYHNHKSSLVDKEFQLGYTLFKIMETLQYFSDNKLKITEISDKRFRKFYDDAEFYNKFLQDIYYVSMFNDTTYKQLWAIKYYLDLCSTEPKYSLIEYLVVLASCEVIEVKPLSQMTGFAAQRDYFFTATNEDNIKKIFNTYDTNKSDAALFYSCEYSNLVDICIASLQCIFNSRFIIKKCENCGKYFIPFNRTDTIYCDRVSPQDPSKSCREAGPFQTYKNKLQTSKASKLYRTIYMQKQMLVRRNPDIMERKRDFENYKIQSKQWKLDVKNGIRTEEDYLNWLESIKKMKE